MRSLLVLVATALCTLTGCATVFQRADLNQDRDEIFSRATLIVIGVIEDQQMESEFWFRAATDRDGWRIGRRTIRVETVLSGPTPLPQIDVYEVFGILGASNDWNSTRVGERAIFPLREEQGHYRLVQDWFRSIFPVTTGPHDRLPLDPTRSLGERIALMNWWLPSDPSLQIRYPQFFYLDPLVALTEWRRVKLQRGLLRHPSPHVRADACLYLLQLTGWGQDECWELLTLDQQQHIRDGGTVCCTADSIAEERAKRDVPGYAAKLWETYRDPDFRRIMTTINTPKVRVEMCRLYNAEYPGDTDTGCPADLPPPATIVTQQGDVPLIGDWPTVRR